MAKECFPFYLFFTSMAPICGFVVLLPNKKKKLVFFFSSMSVSSRSRLLLRIMLLFLLGSGISLAYLPLLFFSPVEVPEELVHWLFSANNCGDFSPLPLTITSLPLSHCHMQQEQCGSRKTMFTPPCLLLASCLPGT